MSALKIILPSGYEIEGVSSVSFQLFNSIFDDEVLRGSYTSAITIPATDNNRVALGFGNVPTVVTQPTRTIPNVVAWVAGQLLQCSLKIVNATDTAFVGSLLLGWGTIVEDMENTLLSEVEMNPVPLVDSVVANYTDAEKIAANRANYDAYLVALKERILELNTTPGSLVFPYMNFLNDFFRGSKNQMFVDFDGTIDSFDIFQPAIFLKDILTEGFSAFGKVVSGLFLEDEDVQRILLISDRDIYKRYIDRIAGQEWITYPVELEPKLALPKITFLEFIKKLKSTFWLPIDMHYFDRSMKIRTWDEVFDGTKVVDWTDLVEGNSLVDIRKEDAQGFKIEYWTNQPDEFYNRVFQDFSEKVVKPTVATFADLPTSPLPGPYDIRYVNSLGFYFTANVEDDNVDPARPWVPYAYSIIEPEIGDMPQSRVVILPTIEDCKPMDYPSFDEDLIGLVTRYFGFENSGESFQGPCFFNSYDKNTEKGVQTRLSFWMGKCVRQEFIGDNPYTFMSSGVGEVADGFPFPIIPDLDNTGFSLFQTKNQAKPRINKNGLFEKFGNRLYTFLQQTKKVRFKVNLKENDITQVDNVLKYRIGNDFYFLDTIRGNFPITTSCEVEAWWIPPGTVLPQNFATNGIPVGNTSGFGGETSSEYEAGSGPTAGGTPGPAGPAGPAGPVGPAGADGADGANGATGNGIASSSYNSGTGVLTLTFTDASTYSTGDLRGADSGTAFKYFSDITASTVTGTTANTILRSLLIPANTFTVGSLFDFLVRISRFSFGGAATLRIYSNTTNSLSGATLWLSVSLGGGITSQIVNRDVAVFSGTNTEIGNSVSFSTAAVSVNVNWTVDQYFIVAVQPVAVSEIYTNKIISIHPRN